MKEQKFELKEDSIPQKKSYEKPEFSAVALFADQVLGGCLIGISSGCSDSDPSKNA
ncbi:hypothetical protein [Candidatus Electronema sp. JM]|uniref:hypothetical protein n=1 Tax=Candidatus Electronema sp. JM TaxID=3401571 RepID=UPI003AA90D96